jgi:hypothetical protein
MFINFEGNTRSWKQDVTEGCLVQTEGTGCHCRTPQCRFRKQDITAGLHSADLRNRIKLGAL